METDKDINQKDTTILGPEKDIIESNSQYGLSLFSKAKFFELASKRTERIVTALYMITDFLKDTEPIRTEIRGAGLSLMSRTHDIGQNNGLYFSSQFPELKSLFGKIVSFLEIGSTMSIISDMNYQIIKNELIALLGNYDSKRKVFETNVSSVVPKEENDNFEVITTEEKKPSTAKSIKDILERINEYKGHPQQGESSLKSKPMAVKDNHKSKQGESSLKINDRKDKIISILKAKKNINLEGGGATIGEIAAEIKGVSEKTIQRQLQHLMSLGLVIRTGKKRWSKYSLKSN